MSVLNPSHPCRGFTLCTLGILFSTCALAAASRDAPAAQAQYRQDRAACNAGQSTEDRATCLKEAGAALQAARSGQLTSESLQDYQYNALRRCDKQPPQDRQDCVARMQNPAEGSVEGGGLLRQAQTPVQ